MRIIIKFVLKNISEKKLRTSLILFAIMISTALIFTSSAISDTFGKMLIEKIKQSCGTSEIMISPYTYSKSQFFTTSGAKKV